MCLPTFTTVYITEESYTIVILCVANNNNDISYQYDHVYTVMGRTVRTARV